MRPSHEQERQLLLAQHARLRTDVEAAWGAARKVLASGTGVGELHLSYIDALAEYSRSLVAVEVAAGTPELGL